MAQSLQRPQPASLVNLNGQLVLAGSNLPGSAPQRLTGVPSGGKLVEDAAGHLVWQPAASAQAHATPPAQLGNVLHLPGQPAAFLPGGLMFPSAAGCSFWPSLTSKGMLAMPGGQGKPGKLAVPPWMVAAQPMLLPSPGPGAPSILVMPGPPMMWPGPPGSGPPSAFLQPSFLPLPLSQPSIPQPLPQQAAASQPPASAPSPPPSKQADSLPSAPSAAQQGSLQAGSECGQEQADNSVASPSSSAATLPPGPAADEGRHAGPADCALQGLAVLADAALASQPAGRSAQHSGSAGAPSASCSCHSSQHRQAPKPTASYLGLLRSAIDLTARPDRPTAFSAWTHKAKPGLERQLPSFVGFDELARSGKGCKDVQPAAESSVLGPVPKAASTASANSPSKRHVSAVAFADAPARPDRSSSVSVKRARLMSV